MKIMVKSREVAQKNGTSGSTGKAYSIRSQEAWVEAAGETRRIQLVLENDQPAYEVGAYVVTDQSFYVGNYGRLTLGRLVLAPVAAAQARTA